MSRHVTYRGATIDMDSLRRENENVVAVGNHRVNAKGDQLSRGLVTKTADQIARENHRVQATVVKTGLKGKPPVAPTSVIEKPKETKTSKKVPEPEKKVSERELPSGDIVIEDDNS